jgi:hypothetical protein
MKAEAMLPTAKEKTIKLSKMRALYSCSSISSRSECVFKMISGP